MYFKEINEYYLRMMLLKTGIFMNKYIFLIFWCGRRDSNSHGKPTRPSSVPVYQFQHDRFNNATINE